MHTLKLGNLIYCDAWDKAHAAIAKALGHNA